MGPGLPALARLYANTTAYPRRAPGNLTNAYEFVRGSSHADRRTGALPVAASTGFCELSDHPVARRGDSPLQANRCYGQCSSILTAPKSIRVPLSIVVPGGTFCEQTFQFRSHTWCRPAPVASCDVVMAIP